MKSISAVVSDERLESFPVALIVSEFNRPITDALKTGALERLAACGFKSEDILLVSVPGAVEIPLVAKRIAQQKKVAVIIALGAVIRGETTHYDYVCQQVSSGCQQVSLMFDVPVIFGVITTENEAQAWDRVGGKHGHKGVEAVDCARAMRAILKALSF